MATSPTPVTPPLTQRPAWQALQAHDGRIRDVHLCTLFAEDPQRGERLMAEGVGPCIRYLPTKEARSYGLNR
jgi:glucose-6-phosphate isomerase